MPMNDAHATAGLVATIKERYGAGRAMRLLLAENTAFLAAGDAAAGPRFSLALRAARQRKPDPQAAPVFGAAIFL
jgi:hypothetical protein